MFMCVYFSHALSLCTILLNSQPPPTPTPTSATAFEFEEVGGGYCEDSDGRYYDRVSFQNSGVGGIGDLDACKAACLQCHDGGHQLVGLYHSYRFCDCLFENESSSTESNCGVVEIGYFYESFGTFYYDSFDFFNLEGTGPIDSSNTSEGEGGTCYKAVEPTTPSPTVAPPSDVSSMFNDAIYLVALFLTLIQ